MSATRRARLQSKTKAIAKPTHFISRVCPPDLCNLSSNPTDLRIKPEQAEFDKLDSLCLSIFRLIKTRYYENPATKKLASVRKELFITLLLGLQSFEMGESFLEIEKFKRSAASELGSVIEEDSAGGQFDAVLESCQSIFANILRPEHSTTGDRVLCMCELANMTTIIESRLEMEKQNLEYDTSFISPTTWINHFVPLIESGEVSGRKWTGNWKKKMTLFLAAFVPTLAAIQSKCFNVMELEKWCTAVEGLGGLEIKRIVELYDPSSTIAYHDYLKSVVKAVSNGRAIDSARYELLASKQFELGNYSNAYRMDAIACTASPSARINCAIARMKLDEPKHYSLAILDLSFALERSETAEAFELRGRALLALGLNESAIQDFERAIELDPSSTAVKKLAIARSNAD